MYWFYEQYGASEYIQSSLYNEEMSILSAPPRLNRVAVAVVVFEVPLVRAGMVSRALRMVVWLGTQGGAHWFQADIGLLALGWNATQHHPCVLRGVAATWSRESQDITAMSNRFPNFNNLTYAKIPQGGSGLIKALIAGGILLYAGSQSIFNGMHPQPTVTHNISMSCCC